MQTQEVVTLITRLPEGTANITEPIINTYPELYAMLNNGMYIESCNQTLISADRYVLTFVFKPLKPEQSN